MVGSSSTPASIRSKVPGRPNGIQKSIAIEEARVALKQVSFPPGSVKHHRRRAGLVGAMPALLSACENRDRFHQVLHGDGSFEQRFAKLHHPRAPQWGRTTCFDLLARATMLGIGGRTYRPITAQLAGSTGPRRGFEAVWGSAVSKENAGDCEALLRWWTTNWDSVCATVGVSWSGEPLDSADLEKYLCIFNKSPAPTRPHLADRRGSLVRPAIRRVLSLRVMRSLPKFRLRFKTDRIPSWLRAT
jgi:hypothetical protein